MVHVPFTSCTKATKAKATKALPKSDRFYFSFHNNIQKGQN